MLFLDLDGVLIPARSWKAPELLEDDFPAFSEQAVRILNLIIAEARIRIILLTTSHKSRFTVQDWAALFARRGVISTGIGCLPENLDFSSRKDELMRWLERNPADRFFILDDDTSLHELPPPVKRFFIQTSPLSGLREAQLETIRAILAQDPSLG